MKIKAFVSYLLIVVFGVQIFLTVRGSDYVINQGGVKATRADVINMGKMLESIVEKRYVDFYATMSYYLNSKASDGLFSKIRVTDQQIEEFVQRYSLFMIDGKFSKKLYQDELQKMKMNDAMFRQYVDVWLRAQQILVPIDYFLNREVGQKIIDKMCNSIVQIKTGQWQKIPIIEYKPAFTDQELNDLKNFYVFKKYSGQINANVYGVYVTDKQLERLREKLSLGLSLSRAAEELNLSEFTLKLENGERISKNISSKQLESTIMNWIDPNSIGIPMILNHDSRKIVLILEKYTKGELYREQYFNEQVMPAWGKRDTTQMIVRDWIKRKSLDSTAQLIMKDWRNNKRTRLVEQKKFGMNEPIVVRVSFSDTDPVYSRIFKLEKVNDDGKGMSIQTINDELYALCVTDIDENADAIASVRPYIKQQLRMKLMQHLALRRF